VVAREACRLGSEERECVGACEEEGVVMIPLPQRSIHRIVVSYGSRSWSVVLQTAGMTGGSDVEGTEIKKKDLERFTVAAANRKLLLKPETHESTQIL
jgi:hypothetical protein